MRDLLLLLIFLSPFLLKAQADTILSFTLEQALQHAVSNSYRTRVADLDIDQSRKKIHETTAIGMPQITGAASYQNFLKLPVTLIPAEFFGGEPGEFAEVTFGTKHNATAEITGTQLIFDGSYFVGLQAAKTYMELSQNNLIKEKSEIRDAVVRSYGTVLVAEENLRILNENKHNLERILFETKQIHKEGFVEEQDVDQLQLLVLNMENQVNNAKRQVKIAYDLLKFQMGVKLQDSVYLTETLEGLTDQFLSKEGFSGKYDPSSLVEYKLINTSERLNYLNMKNAQAGYLPRLSGFFSHRQQAFRNEFNLLDTDQNWFPTTVWGVNLQVPIFTSFMNNSRVQQAKIDWERTKIRKEEISEALRLRIEKASSDYSFALERYGIEKKNLELAKRIREKVQVKYKEGMVTSLELMQVENQFLQTQGNFIQSIFQLLNSRSELDKALGNYQ